jgi:hypothetical protein
MGGLGYLRQPRQCRIPLIPTMGWMSQTPCDILRQIPPKPAIPANVAKCRKRLATGIYNQIKTLQKMSRVSQMSQSAKTNDQRPGCKGWARPLRRGCRSRSPTRPCAVATLASLPRRCVPLSNRRLGRLGRRPWLDGRRPLRLRPRTTVRPNRAAIRPDVSRSVRGVIGRMRSLRSTRPACFGCSPEIGSSP